MMRAIVAFLLAALWAWLLAATVTALGAETAPRLVFLAAEPDIVGDVDGMQPSPRKILHDTLWLADWSFDGASSACDDTGWLRVDNRILNDGMVYWTVTSALAGTGGIAGKAAALAYSGNTCCAAPDGYDNGWYQAIRLEYTGAATLSFDYLLDSEPNRDFLRIESDSACASFALVNYDLDPRAGAASFRSVEFSTSGLDLAGSIESLPLDDYGPGPHCVYIGFFSNGTVSPCDGLLPSTIGAAVVVDNLALTDAAGTRTEDFETGVLGIGVFANVHDLEPFGEWARMVKPASDNDFCTENRTCAWLFTDHTTPTLANDPSMAFGPGGFVVRNWLDDVIVSPWVSLAGAPAGETVFQYRIFPGNFFSQSRIVHNWSVRGRPALEGTSCISNWEQQTWTGLSQFFWLTSTRSMSSFFDPAASDIQIRFRTSDWQWIAGASPPSPFVPGPGPYFDRLRIGRVVLDGPVFVDLSVEYRAQDAFPTEILPTGPGTGEHFQPSTDRFGTCAFSGAQDVLSRGGPRLIVGDSIWALVRDLRNAGGVTSIEWHGAIVAGPHAGKAPAPWTVGSNGFFVVPADSSRDEFLGMPIPDSYFVDLDDTYFRGGDVVHYFWLATDALGGVTSDPPGLSSPPVSVVAAEAVTGGLLEVSYLPAVDWDPAYLARLGADPHGDLEPTAAELANSTQRNCILYVQQVNFQRRSGDMNRTSFMYTLDRLGYRGDYDVYDHMGCCTNTNNHMGGRATVEQALGYSLIVYDAGNLSPSVIMPDGSFLDTQKIDQASWFRDWLAQASTSDAGFATLWVIASNALQEKPTAALYNTDMGVVLDSPDQGLSITPEVDGIALFTFDRGPEQAAVDFGTDLYILNGGCPNIRNYDGLGASGTAVVTHRYRSPTTGALGDGAIVMNRNDAGNWNTILQSHAWSDIVEAQNGAPAFPQPEEALLLAVLNGTLPLGCLQAPDPTDTRLPSPEVDVPVATALHQNVPNPFNPATVIRFDLAQGGRVQLRIYDVAGRLVRRLIDQEMAGGRNHSAVWNGLDDQNRRAGSGLYFYRLDAGGASLTKKLVVVK